MNGIDVSKWQGGIDWPRVKADGIDFAIIKAGGSDAGFYRDESFERNYAGAKAAGIQLGAYYYVGPNFIGRENGIADAERFAALIRGKQFEFPVYVDIEQDAFASNKAGCTEAAAAFCEYLEREGFYAGIYGSEYRTFREMLGDVSRFTAWVANWSREPQMPWGVWQTGATGRVAGIDGNVDTDVCYTDFAERMLAAGLNGYERAETEKNDGSLPDIAERLQSILDELKSIIGRR